MAYALQELPVPAFQEEWNRRSDLEPRLLHESSAVHCECKMRNPSNVSRLIFSRRLLAGLFLLLLVAGSTVAHAQQRMTIQAVARGTSTQMGKIYNVTIIIEQFSTPDDQKALIDAFQSRGQDGLVDVLEDMKPKGRVSFSSGGVGNDVKYIVEMPSDKGRRIRLVTDRNVAFGEMVSGSRSKDYNVGAIDLLLTPDGKGSSGTVLPAVRMKVNKKTNQIELETYQNPWELLNLSVHKDE